MGAGEVDGKDMFFPDGHDYHAIRNALRFCRQCPVIAQCGAEAMKDLRPDGYGLRGIWGGMYLTGEQYTDSHGTLRPRTISLNEAGQLERSTRQTRVEASNHMKPVVGPMSVEEPPEDPTVCPACGERLDYLGRCPNWMEHESDRRGENDPE
jgi:hypothetical protein